MNGRTSYKMKIRVMVFTEGTILMHKNATGHTREEIVKQVNQKELSVRDYASYIPIGNAAKKLRVWQDQGIEILYLTSRTKLDEVNQIRTVLKKHDFPDGQLLFRRKGEGYKDVAERAMPNILIEDDCESIGGTAEMTITNIRPEIKKKIKSIVIREFDGIDYLPNKIHALLKYS